MDFLEFSDIQTEVRGAMMSGRLKLTDQHIIFKNSKTGKVEQILGADIDALNWQRLAGGWGLRIFLKNGMLHRFGGFREADEEKLSKFFTQNYEKDMLEKELSVKGWNWGTAKFNGSLLGFEVGNADAFEIPLMHVSQCIPGKNEIALEFHQNDDTPVSLLEMRFHIPPSELAGSVDPVEAFQQQVMQKASVISATGDAIATFREIQCLTPRGRYDIKIYPTFLQLHGKTFDYKIPISTVLRLFLLPHKDSRQMFFVMSLDPPIKQGQTRYHFLVFLFNQEDETTVELSLTEEEIEKKYEAKLEKEIEGLTYEVVSKVMKVLVNRKITVPGSFIGNSGTPAIGCSFKAAAGYLYPLERGFIYVHKPPIHIRFEEIAAVNFARSGGSTRSFDFEVELKNGGVHTFSSIEKEEYGKFFDFIGQKKLMIKNRGKMNKAEYSKDEFSDSDHEAAPDAYLERVKAEGEERIEEGMSDESSEDEDFNPDIEGASDVAEEYDSNPSTTESSEDDDDDDDDDKHSGSGEEKAKRKKKEKERKPKLAKTVSEKPRKPRKKKEKDETKPKRPLSAYFIWLNENRESIKADNPGISITELSRKAGEIWKKVEDRSEYEAKANKAKEEYEKAMKDWKETAGNKDTGKAHKKERDENKPKRPPSSYMIWLNDYREKIKADNPGISVTELLKKAGELWRELKDKGEYETKAVEAKKDYDKAMEKWRESGGGKQNLNIEENRKPKKSGPVTAVNVSPTKAGSGAGFKSKEYISSDESSTDEDDKPLKSVKEKTIKKEPKKESDHSDADDEDNGEEAPSSPMSVDEGAASGSESN